MGLNRSPLNKRSKKREEIYKLRRPLVQRLLTEKPWCEACPIFAVIDGKATYKRIPSMDVHEVISRGRGGSILDERNLMCLCRPCHNRITTHPAEGESVGALLPSWATGDMMLEAAAVRTAISEGGWPLQVQPSWLS
jgi:hypothetical protein